MTIKDTSFVLASHREWKIWADFETITLENPAGQRWEIGDMYGNPQGGLITSDEKYAVVIGCGVMIADLNRFGEVITGSSSWLETPVVTAQHEKWSLGKTPRKTSTKPVQTDRPCF